MRFRVGLRVYESVQDLVFKGSGFRVPGLGFGDCRSEAVELKTKRCFFTGMRFPAYSGNLADS